MGIFYLLKLKMIVETLLGMKFKLFLIITLLLSQSAFSQDLKQFLKSCGYGTLAGAGLGLASLVFEKKPNESFVNIARGASLGLYGGLAYGLFAMNQEANKPVNDIVKGENNKLFVYPTANGKIETLYVFHF